MPRTKTPPLRKSRSVQIRLGAALVLGLVIVLLTTAVSTWNNWVRDGEQTYAWGERHVGEMVAADPAFFAAVFHEFLPLALECANSAGVADAAGSLGSTSSVDSAKHCAQDTRALIDAHPGHHHNQLPLYFIQLQPDGRLAKLFFSGDLHLEVVDTRGEQKVAALLRGQRTSLYGPYYDQEVFSKGKDTQRKWYDPKPAYLRDLYAQFEIIVPYYENDRLVGAVVYLYSE